jgi:hypothetical protein
MKAPKKDDMSGIPDGAMGEEVTGRKHIDQAQTELIDDSDNVFRP